MTTAILQVSPSDGAGGAEKIAGDLLRAYRREGWISEMAVGRKTGSDAGVFELRRLRAPNLWKRSWSWLSRQFRRDGKLPLSPRLDGWCHHLAEPVRTWRVRRGQEDFDYPGADEFLALARHQPSLVQCHNLHGGYFDLRTIAALSRQVPTLLTLHDAWLLSGHCAHSLDCTRWQSGCGACPDLTLYPAVQRDATAFNWKRKQAIYAGGRFYVSTPSAWLMAKVERSMLAPALIERRVIPNGVDLSVFQPADQGAARLALDIPPTAKVVLVAGHRLRSNAFKDFAAARAAIAQAAESVPDLCVLTLGEAAPDEWIGRARVRSFAFEPDAARVAGFFQAADLYLHPAAADTFPSAVIEALACGTPVIATAVGGIPEQVRDGLTGLLAPGGDTALLAHALVRLLERPELRLQMAAAAAEDAAARFDQKRSHLAYLQWIREIAGASGPAAPGAK